MFCLSLWVISFFLFFHTSDVGLYFVRPCFSYFTKYSRDPPPAGVARGGRGITVRLDSFRLQSRWGGVVVTVYSLLLFHHTEWHPPLPGDSPRHNQIFTEAHILKSTSQPLFVPRRDRFEVFLARGPGWHSRTSEVERK